MATLIFKDRLDRVLNFNSWKERVFNILEENDLDGYMTRVFEEPFDDMGKQLIRRIKQNIRG